MNNSNFVFNKENLREISLKAKKDPFDEEAVSRTMNLIAYQAKKEALLGKTGYQTFLRDLKPSDIVEIKARLKAKNFKVKVGYLDQLTLRW